MNWPEESRVVITLVYLDGTTLQLEYDYLNRGQDGQGVWNVCNSLADTYGVTCSWDSGGRHWLGVNSNVVLRSAKDNYDDKAFTGDARHWVQTTVQFYALKLGSMEPRGKLNFANVEYIVGGNSTSQMKINTDSSGPLTCNSVVAASNGSRQALEWQPKVRRDDVGAGVKFTITSIAGTQATRVAKPAPWP